MTVDEHKVDCQCFDCHRARRMAHWQLWCQLLTGLYEEILRRHYRTSDYDLVAITAPQSIWYSIEAFRPRSNDSPVRKTTAFWKGEDCIHVHTPSSIEPTKFAVRIENGVAELQGRSQVEFVSLMLAPFT